MKNVSERRNSWAQFGSVYRTILCFGFVLFLVFAPLVSPFSALAQQNQSHSDSADKSSSDSQPSSSKAKDSPPMEDGKAADSDSKSKMQSRIADSKYKTQSQTTGTKSKSESQTAETKSKTLLKADDSDLDQKFPVTGEELEGVPLTIGGVEILRFKGTISGFTPEQRVRAILFRIHELEQAGKLNIDGITTRETGFSTDIVTGAETIFTITSRDARLVGTEAREDLALQCVTKIKDGLNKEKLARSPKTIFMATVSTGVALVALLLSLAALSAVFPWLYKRIEDARGKYIGAVRIQKAELLSEESLTEILIGFCRLFRALVTFILLIAFVEASLSFYPSTKEISGQVTEKFVYPFIAFVVSSITAYVPNLLIIIAVAIGTYYLVTFTRFIFNEIGRGSITVAGFESEWAEPTFSIFRFLIVAFALVLTFPYLPGSGSPAFQQVSIFLGVLISLGSSGAVANIIAGVFLTYTGAFRIGDRVRIADTVGDVIERRLLYTRIRTIKDEFITIPNSLVLGSHIVNYSASLQGNGLVLHTTVTIGYNVDWRTVEKLLIDAAKETEHVRAEPPPFVFITSLDDFFVTHQINAYTSTPHSMAHIYAQLHKNILDKFNEAGVEIMSPHYHSVRDGSADAIPPDFQNSSPDRKSIFPYKKS